MVVYLVAKSNFVAVIRHHGCNIPSIPAQTATQQDVNMTQAIVLRQQASVRYDSSLQGFLNIIVI